MSSVAKELERVQKVLGYAVDRGLYFRKYMTSEEREAVAAEEVEIIQTYRALPGLIEQAAELENGSPALVGIFSIYSRIVDHLRTIPSYHIPRSYLTHHADPMGRGKDETAIEVALHLNDTSDASLPIQTRFDATTMKFMLVDGRFVRTSPKELPEMPEEAAEVVRQIEVIICKE